MGRTTVYLGSQTTQPKKVEQNRELVCVKQKIINKDRQDKK